MICLRMEDMEMMSFFTEGKHCVDHLLEDFVSYCLHDP